MSVQKVCVSENIVLFQISYDFKMINFSKYKYNFYETIHNMPKLLLATKRIAVPENEDSVIASKVYLRFTRFWRFCVYCRAKRTVIF